MQQHDNFKCGKNMLSSHVKGYCCYGYIINCTNCRKIYTLYNFILWIFKLTKICSTRDSLVFFTDSSSVPLPKVNTTFQLESNEILYKQGSIFKAHKLFIVSQAKNCHDHDQGMQVYFFWSELDHSNLVEKRALYTVDAVSSTFMCSLKTT